MGFILVPMLVGVFYVGYQMMKLSIAIAKERHPDKKQETTVFNELLLGNSFHLWIGPYFSEYGDSAKVRQFIKIRNQWVAILWSIMVIGMIAALMIKKFSQS
jgi:hypothetical protein